MSAGFAITGMPFSGMPWLSVLLTTDKSVCYPEPLRDMNEPEDVGRIMDAKGYEYVGVADSALAFFPEIIEQLLVPTVIVMQEPNHSLARVVAAGSEPIPAERFINNSIAALTRLQRLPLTLTVMASQVRRREVAQQIFWHCLPNLAFDQVRYDLLAQLVIEQSVQSVLRSTQVQSGMQIAFRSRYEGIGATLQ